MEEHGCSDRQVSCSDQREEANASTVKNRSEDVAWLYSLSEAEIDWLISLKELATKRAKHVGHKDLADKFDLRVLRSLGSVVLEFLKDRLAQSTEVLSSDELLARITHYKLDCFVQNNGAPSKDTEDMKTLTSVSSKRKRMQEGFAGVEGSKPKRPKTRDARFNNITPAPN